MKKKLLLILPALMVLSACSNASLQAKADGMIEDTELHAEIFGDLPEFEQETKTLLPRKLAEGELYTPVLGFQRKTNGDGTFSVRFVATLEASITSATWTRSVHDLTGDAIKTKGYKTVEKIYNSLNNNGSPVSATSVVQEDEEGSATPFSYYAVYCLLNIPSDKSDYYVDAFITVSNGVKSKSSMVGSLNVADGDKHLKYSLVNYNRDVAALNGVVIESGTLDGNKVALYDLSLKANDKLQFFWINEEDLVYILNTSVAIGGSHQHDFSISSNVLTVEHSGTYKLFLTGDGGGDPNKLYFQKVIYLQAPSWWTTDVTPYVTENNGSTSNDRAMTHIKTLGSGEQLCSAYVDISNNYRIGFFRRGASDYNWTDFTNIDTTGKELCVIEGSDTTFTKTWANYVAS